MPSIKARPMKPTIGIEVINITCECGGSCVNDRGSSMIEAHDVTVECTVCGQTYSVPTSVFTRKLRTTRGGSS